MRFEADCFPHARVGLPKSSPSPNHQNRRESLEILITKMMSRKKLRFSILLVFGIALVSFAISYIQFVLARPIGSGPAGPKVARERFEKPWSDKLVRVVGIGDSITAGLGARSKDHTFFNRLIDNPDDEYADMKGICLSSVLTQLAYENLAISGSTSLQHMAVIEDRLTVQDANVFGLIVMTTGGNDLIHSYGRSPPREGAMYGATLERSITQVGKISSSALAVANFDRTFEVY